LFEALAFVLLPFLFFALFFSCLFSLRSFSRLLFPLELVAVAAASLPLMGETDKLGQASFCWALPDALEPFVPDPEDEDDADDDDGIATDWV